MLHNQFRNVGNSLENELVLPQLMAEDLLQGPPLLEKFVEPFMTGTKGCFLMAAEIPETSWSVCILLIVSSIRNVAFPIFELIMKPLLSNDIIRKCATWERAIHPDNSCKLNRDPHFIAQARPLEFVAKPHGIKRKLFINSEVRAINRYKNMITWPMPQLPVLPTYLKGVRYTSKSNNLPH